MLLLSVCSVILYNFLLTKDKRNSIPLLNYDSKCCGIVRIHKIRSIKSKTSQYGIYFMRLQYFSEM